MKYLFLLTFLIGVISGCNDKDTEGEASVMIRVENISTYDFNNMKVESPGETWDVGNVSVGTKSEYRNFSLAYEYAFIQVEIAGNIYRLQPIDYVGETPLKKGNYTYEIGVSDLSGMYGSLTLNLKKEK